MANVHILFKKMIGAPCDSEISLSVVHPKVIKLVAQEM
jgi:hypothetical protein